jgi:hypothetical protein
MAKEKKIAPITPTEEGARRIRVVEYPGDKCVIRYYPSDEEWPRAAELATDVIAKLLKELGEDKLKEHKLEVN